MKYDGVLDDKKFSRYRNQHFVNVKLNLVVSEVSSIYEPRNIVVFRKLDVFLKLLHRDLSIERGKRNRYANALQFQCARRLEFEYISAEWKTAKNHFAQRGTETRDLGIWKTDCERSFASRLPAENR